MRVWKLKRLSAVFVTGWLSEAWCFINVVEFVMKTFCVYFSVLCYIESSVH